MNPTLFDLSHQRYTIRVAGESGMGLNSVGDILAQAIKEAGYYTFSYREYPSLIKGGYAFQQVEMSDQPLSSPSRFCDLLICLSRVSLHKYLSHLRPRGLVLYSFTKLTLSTEEEALVAERQLTLVEVPAMKLAFEAGGTYIMTNSVLNGLVWQVLKLDLDFLVQVVKKSFSSKPEVIDQNLACIHQGHSHIIEIQSHTPPQLVAQPKLESLAAINGNQAVALGAIAAGVRAYFAYPMSPSTGILSYLASLAKDTGMLVKQIEDEIAVANMTIGAMHMGTRALCATSGGGFDLMTEAVSLAAMTETPFVCVVAQRPGPATGLPTWSSAGDLLLAAHAGHGEYTRLVIAASDIESAYRLTQEAFNWAEEYQIPVILLSEKHLAESLYLIDQLPKALPIERHLVSKDQLKKLKPSDRYAITDSGISPRWLPGSAAATYDANSDEHAPDGSLTEESVPAQAMYDKRLRKTQQLLASLPQPQLHGPEVGAQLTLVGWGSLKSSLLDAIKLWNAAHPNQAINYLHFEYLYPLTTAKLLEVLDAAAQVVLIEQNATAQLGQLILQATGRRLEQTLLKYDGRPFFIEELLEYFDQKLPLAGHRRKS